MPKFFSDGSKEPPIEDLNRYHKNEIGTVVTPHHEFTVRSGVEQSYLQNAPKDIVSININIIFFSLTWKFILLRRVNDTLVPPRIFFVKLVSSSRTLSESCDISWEELQESNCGIRVSFTLLKIDIN